MAINSIPGSTAATTIASVTQKNVPESQEPKGVPDRDGDSDDTGKAGGVQSIPPSVNTQGQAIGKTISVKA